ncbi:MAG: hypothetical protein LBN99_03650 [Oscillospiraceae bacterium]|jgi:hypothetical protein|nr:hypothetical protein [Oscillospiraceae bacterium]
MNVKPYLKDFGFSHRESKHMVVAKGEKLWISLAATGGFMTSAGADPGAVSAGLLEINLFDGGTELAYTYSATESLIVLESAKGAVRIAIDAPSNALLFEGEGVTLQLNAGSAGQFVTSLKTPAGIELSIGGGRYLFAAKRGSVEFDDTWILSQFHSVTPILTLSPEGGKVALVAYELPVDTTPVEITRTLDECAKGNAAEFAAFKDGLVATPAEWDDVRDNIAYLLWINKGTLLSGAQVVLENKRRSPDTQARFQAIASLAFKDADTALGLLTALPFDAPPVESIALLRLIDEGALARAHRGTVYDLYNALGDSARQWARERSVTPGLYAYAYRFETGIKKTTLFGAGEPVAAPDLNAYLLLQSEALAKLAESVWESGDAIRWRESVKTQRAALIAHLWNGETFVGENVRTGAKSAPDPVLSYMPLVLGKRLPAEIAEKLAQSVDGEALESAIGTLAILGLKDAGCDEAASKLTLAALGRARADGVDCPFYGAALLALAHKVL